MWPNKLDSSVNLIGADWCWSYRRYHSHSAPRAGREAPYMNKRIIYTCVRAPPCSHDSNYMFIWIEMAERRFSHRRWAFTTLLIRLFVETGGMKPRARSLCWPSRAMTLTWYITGLEHAGNLQGIIKHKLSRCHKVTHAALGHTQRRLVLTCRCLKVSSFGSLSLFTTENKVGCGIWISEQIFDDLVTQLREKWGKTASVFKPAGAADRCLDCPVEKDCPYSACKIYLDSIKQVQFPQFKAQTQRLDRKSSFYVCSLCVCALGSHWLARVSHMCKLPPKPRVSDWGFADWTLWSLCLRVWQWRLQ